MRQLVKFDFCNVREPHSEIVLPKQVPVIVSHNWSNQVGIVDIFINYEDKGIYLDFSLYNWTKITDVTNFDIKPIIKTMYYSLKQITITGFSLNKKS